MKGVFAAATAALCAIASAKELPVDMARKAELYDSGIRHQQIMDRKNVRWFLSVWDEQVEVLTCVIPGCVERARCGRRV